MRRKTTQTKGIKLMKHEQSLADAFNDHIKEQAVSRGARVHTFSMDGQDRDAAADYLIAHEDRFALIEFKYLHSDIASEKKKSRRLKLCQSLEEDEAMTKLHDRCHFIMWGHDLGGEIRLVANIYRREVCNQLIFGEGCGLAELTPSSTSKILAGNLANELISKPNPRTLSLEEFEKYLEWLLVETSSSAKSTLEIVARNTKTNDLALVKFSSVRAAHDWLIQNKPAPLPRPRIKF